jgi:Uma2 family endonuclease
MISARRVHGEVAGACFAILRQYLNGSGCRAYINVMKVRVEVADAVFYPDVFVTCDARDLASDYVFAHPVLVIEVLSETTAGYDRGFKFAAYRQLESLLEYVLLDPDRRSVEVLRRGADGLFTLHDFFAADIVELASVDARFARPELFEGV